MTLNELIKLATEKGLDFDLPLFSEDGEWGDSTVLNIEQTTNNLYGYSKDHYPEKFLLLKIYE